MLNRAGRILLPLLFTAAIAGCGAGGGSGGSRASTTAPTTSGTTGPTTSATLPPIGTNPGPGTGTGSGGTGGAVGEFTRTYGGRRYVLLAPAKVGSAPQPLVVMFHGSGDDCLNYANTAKAVGWFQAATAQGVLLVVPDTKSPYASFPVWSGNPNNDIPQMKTELADVLELVAKDVMTRYDVEKRSVHALGFSDGGLFVGAVGLPEPTFATCTITGYGWGAFDIAPINVRRPVHLACGTADSFYAAADATQAFLRQKGHEVLWEPVAGVGHLFSGISQAIKPGTALSWMTARPLAGAGGATSPPTTPPGSFPPNPPKGVVTRPVTTTAQPGLPALAGTYTVYVPSAYTPGSAWPLLFASNMGLAPWQALAEQQGIIVVDFRDADQNGGYDFGYDVLRLDAILQDVTGQYRCDMKRLYYHGFSAGAHWGYAVVLANANLFAALAVNAGSLQTAIQQGVFPNNVPRKIPVAIRHGTTDPVVPVSEARLAQQRLMQAGHTVVEEEFAGGHTVSAADAQAVWPFLSQQRLP